MTTARFIGGPKDGVVEAVVSLSSALENYFLYRGPSYPRPSGPVEAVYVHEEVFHA